MSIYFYIFIMTISILSVMFVAINAYLKSHDKLFDAIDAIEKVKQKEPKKPNIELIQKSWYMEGYHDRMFDFEPMWIIKTGWSGPRYEKNPRYGKPLLKEQKSAEWKPSEEQMEALFLVSSVGAPKHRETLKSLYNDLQKL